MTATDKYPLGVPASVPCYPPTPDEIKAIARKIQSEIAHTAPGHRTRIGLFVSQLVGDTARHLWHATVGRELRELREREDATSHEARMLVLRLAGERSPADPEGDRRVAVNEQVFQALKDEPVDTLRYVYDNTVAGLLAVAEEDAQEVPS